MFLSLKIVALYEILKDLKQNKQSGFFLHEGKLITKIILKSSLFA
jgi:hypothetical protein